MRRRVRDGLDRQAPGQQGHPEPLALQVKAVVVGAPDLDVRPAEDVLERLFADVRPALGHGGKGRQVYQPAGRHLADEPADQLGSLGRFVSDEHPRDGAPVGAGTTPSQALSREELQRFLDYADEQVDRAVAAFVEDTSARGMDKDVLLVITGEFGRTPRINGNAGRDHWAPLSTLALAGGGLKMGKVVGESTAKAETPKTTPITPQDLMATVFHVLGVPQDLHYKDPSGRPTPMVDGGKPIAELI